MFAATLCIALSACSVSVRNPATVPSVEATHVESAKSTAPSLVDQEGRNWTLDQLRQPGPTVLLFYRGHWCPWCNKQLGAFSKGYDRIKALGVRFIAISADTPDDNREFATKLGAAFPMLSDEKLTAIQHFGVLEADHDIAVPACFILDENGEVVWQKIGDSIQDRVYVETVENAVKELRTQQKLTAASK